MAWVGRARGPGYGRAAAGGAVGCSGRLLAGGASPGTGAGEAVYPRASVGSAGPARAREPAGADARPPPAATAVGTRLPRRRPSRPVTASSLRARRPATLHSRPFPGGWVRQRRSKPRGPGGPGEAHLPPPARTPPPAEPSAEPGEGRPREGIGQKVDIFFPPWCLFATPPLGSLAKVC